MKGAAYPSLGVWGPAIKGGWDMSGCKKDEGCEDGTKRNHLKFFN